jgi:hypothetical protein
MSHTYSILVPTKKLSQLIAKSWLDKQPITINKEFLVQNNIFSEKEIELFEIEESENPQGGYIDAVNFKIHIPYPERPSQVTDEELQQWLNSPENSPPWVPENETLKEKLIPWQTIYGR